MNKFTILPSNRSYIDPTTNTYQRGVFISKPITAFYHSDYQGGNSVRRQTVGTVENIITTIKNQFKDKSKDVLIQAEKFLIEILQIDFPQLLQETEKDNYTVCVIPRAKAEKTYSPNQLFFKQTVAFVSKNLKGFSDGTDYIVRHTDTRTTHLNKAGYGGNGDLPYPGITKKTCTISDDVKGKNILLVDDLYTETINIDEDTIQALLANGANSVIFYSLGKTAPRT